MDTDQDLIAYPPHCPTTTFGWQPLIRSLWSHQDLPDWPQLKGACIVPFYQGRVALSFLCKVWQLTVEDEILLPAYNCGSEVDPFVAHGSKVIFYRVDGQARIDLQDIKNRCTSKTRVVYITHYFGWPQEIGELYRWCRERGIYVVEDCALSLFSSSDEGYLGTLADASIFSFRKFLSVPDGAALVLNGLISPVAPSFTQPPALQTLTNLLPFCKSSALQWLNACGLYKPLRRWKIKQFDFNKLRKEAIEENFPDMPQGYYFDKRIENWSMTSVSRQILQQTDPEMVKRRRRENYICLLENIRHLSNVEPLFDALPDGVCPLGLLVKVPKRSVVCQALNACGIASFPWWEGYHRQFTWEAFPEAKELKDTLLYLPINQSLYELHVHYIARCLERVVLS